MVPSGDPSREEAQASAEARMMRLRGYGNAIVPSLAAEFVKAWLEVKEEVADADDNAAAVRQKQEGGV